MYTNPQSIKDALEALLRKQRSDLILFAQCVQSMEEITNDSEFFLDLHLANFALRHAEETTGILNEVKGFSLIHLVKK